MSIRFSERSASPRCRPLRSGWRPGGTGRRWIDGGNEIAGLSSTGLAGVRFTQEPTDPGPVVMAVLDDTCGNLIQLLSVKE